MKKPEQFYYIYNGIRYDIPRRDKLQEAIRQGKRPTNRPLKDECLGIYEYITTKQDKNPTI